MRKDFTLKDAIALKRQKQQAEIDSQLEQLEEHIRRGIEAGLPDILIHLEISIDLKARLEANGFTVEVIKADETKGGKTIISGWDDVV